MAKNIHLIQYTKIIEAEKNGDKDEKDVYKSMSNAPHC